MKRILVVFCFLITSSAFATEIEINPGDGPVIIKAGDTVSVSCSSNGEGSASAFLLCDCLNGDGKKFGEGFGTNGSNIAKQCKSQYSDLTPMNCRKQSGPVVCDCVNIDGTKFSEAFGTDGVDLRKQCTVQYSDLFPSNCR